MASVNTHVLDSCFTNRTHDIECCEEAVRTARTSELSSSDVYHVLAWHGDSGAGATELMWELRSRLGSGSSDLPEVALGIVDFAIPKYLEPFETLLKLRADLSRHGRFHFYTFELAFAQLHCLRNPGTGLRDAQALLEEHGGSSSPLSFVLDKVGDLAHLGSSFSGFWWGTGLAYQWGRELAESVGGRAAEYVRSWLDDAETARLRNEIEIERSPGRLERSLPRYFGFDLRRTLRHASPPRVVLMFDHLHRLEYASRRSTPATDDWLRSLVEESPGALVVVFGRHELDWGSDECPIPSTSIESRELKPFDIAHAEQYLRSRGVRSAAIRKRMIKASECKPVFLALCADHFARIVASGARPSVDDFGETPAAVVDSAIDYLSHSERSHLRLASYPEVIDEGLFLDLINAFPGHVCAADWAILTQWRIMQDSDGNGELTMKPNMRSELQSRERQLRPEHFRRIHQWLFSRFDEIARSARSCHEIGYQHDEALVLAARHKAQYDPSRLRAWALDGNDGKLKNFFAAHRWAALLEVFRIASETDLEHVDHGERAKLDLHHASVLQWAGRIAEARPLFERAYDAHELALPHERAERATIAHALADVCFRLAEVDESRRRYREALVLYQDDPSAYKQRYVDVLLSLGMFHDADGDPFEAERFYDDAHRRNREIHDVRSAGYGRFLIALGQTRRQYGRTDGAMTVLRQAADIFENGGEHLSHEGYGTALLELADCEVIAGDRESARSLFEQAVAALEKHGGSEHPNLAHARHRLGRFLCSDLAWLDEGIRSMEQAVPALERALGSVHEWTKEAKEDLGAARGRCAPR